MIRPKFAFAALMIAATLAMPCAAQAAAESSAALIERLKALYPATRIGSVHETPWPGVFEVALGNQLAYVDDTGQYFLFGHLYDMKTQRDLTAERKEAMSRIDFAALPLADALKEVRGSGKRTLAIFSDPDCPYCRKLEAELTNLTNVTLYTFLIPVAALHPHARGKAIAVWCAPDPIGAWRDLMAHDRIPDAGDCAHPVDRNIALAERLGITGTPTLVARDGRVLAGSAGLAQIEAWLARGNTEQTR